MDRHRPDRGGDGGGRFSRMPSRWSDGPLEQRQPFHPPGGGGEGFSGGRHHPYGGVPREFGSRSPGFRQGYGGLGEQHVGIGGPRHGGGGGGGFFGAGRGASPGGNEGTKFAKLFIGSVPRTATEEDIRPLFEEHGHVMEVALIKDKRTGQQQGCCFIKYANSEEADRAIRSLHNQYTLPGGMGPIQVRYADGERERLGAVEHKLFVGSLNKLATEKEVEEIFSPYGRVEDVYIMRDELKQSRGCGFVKFSNREMATAAINALNGVFVMRGCEQPLIVRFADPKRPRPGESRGGPAFGGPGFGPRSQAPPGPRSMSNVDEPISGRFPPNTWRSPESLAQPSHGFSDIQPKGGPMTSSTGYSSTTQVPPIGQQISSMQKATLSPQNFPLQMHHNQQAAMSYSQIQASQAPVQQLSQVQNPHSGGLPSFNRSLSSQQFVGSGGQLSSSQPLLHQGGSSSLQLPLNMQHAVSGQQQVPSSAMSQLHQQTVQQSPAQGQMLPQHQAQSLQSNFQSPQQSYSQMQQQLQSMQVPNLNQQQIPQTLKHQSTNHASVPSSASSAQLNGQVTTPLTCSWTEHTSPEGFKYYYNSATKESKWEKPEELSLFEQQQKLQQQQQQQKVANQQLQSQPQMQLQTQVQPQHQVSQMQPAQAQMQLRHQAQFQQLPPSLPYQNPGAVGHQNIQDLGYSQFQGTGSSADLARVQKGLQSAQEWMWKNKPAGT